MEEMNYLMSEDCQTDQRDFKLMLKRKKGLERGIVEYGEDPLRIRYVMQFYRDLSPFPKVRIFDFWKQ